mgnify:CR=1 FL=1
MPSMRAAHVFLGAGCLQSGLSLGSFIFREQVKVPHGHENHHSGASIADAGLGQLWSGGVRTDDYCLRLQPGSGVERVVGVSLRSTFCETEYIA